MTAIPTVVVDDEPAIREILECHLTDLGCSVATASDARTALDRLRERPVDLVFTDIRMPRMSGLQLLEQLRAISPETAVVVLSGYASMEDTVQALRLGALDFIHKPFERADLSRTLERFRRSRRDARLTAEFLSHMQECSQVLTIPSDPHAARLVAGTLTRDLIGLGLCNAAERDTALLAVHEALLNAIIHGNLRIPSSIKDEDPDRFEALLQQRAQESPYASRAVRIEYRANRSRAEWVIEDEGEGFDPRSAPDPTDPSSLLEISGRGLLIMRLMMTEVAWNERGNQVRMVWRAPVRVADASPSPAPASR